MTGMLRTPWYYGWNIVAAGMAAQAIIFGIALYSFTLWIAPWTNDYGITRGEAMVAFLVVQMGSGLLSPFAGKALDTLPIRYLMLFAGASFASGLALAAIAISFWQIAVIYGLFIVPGMVLGGVIPAAALVARWFDRRRGMAMGISTIGTSMGGFILPPIVAYLQLSFGWRDANFMLAVLSIVVIMLAALTVFNSPADAGLEHEGAAQTATPAPQPAHAGIEWTAAKALKSSAFWAIGISFLMIAFAFNAIQQNLGPIGEDAGMSPATLSGFISVMALVMVLAKLGFGYLADRVQYRNMLTLVLLLIASAVAILAVFEISTVTLLIAVIVLGMGMGGMLPLFGIIVADVFGPASVGRIQGLLIFVMLPSSAGPLLAAAIYDSTGSYLYAWIVFLILLAIGFPIIRSIKAGQNCG